MIEHQVERRHYTKLEQINQLVGVSEANPDLSYMARLLALCSLPRTNPGNRKEYIRRNGPNRASEGACRAWHGFPKGFPWTPVRRGCGTCGICIGCKVRAELVFNRRRQEAL